MSVVHRLSERVQRGEALPPAVDFAMRPAAAAIQWGMRRRLRQPAVRTTAYVISFGNITTGGTGKTPAVIESATQEIAEGRRVAVLTRGYGAPTKEPANSSDLPRCDWYARLGDEAALILDRVPGVVVFKNADRVAAAHQAMSNHGCNVLILDDGFQYTALERDENILVVDAANPFGNGRLLPRGTLREPLDAIARATAVLLTRCDQAADLDPTIETIRQFVPDIPIRATMHQPQHVRHVASGRVETLEWLRGRSVTVACAIGRPEAFVNTLEGLGVRIATLHRFADHAPWKIEHLPPGETIVTTDKDAARIANPPDNLYALSVQLEEWVSV